MLVHVVLIALLVLEPGLFDSTFKRVIRVEGNDYDVRQLTELDLTPLPRPAPKGMGRDSKSQRLVTAKNGIPITVTTSRC